MALVTVNLSDPISSLVTKTNTLSTNVGDLDNLDSSIALGYADSNIVKAINFVYANSTDSAAVISLINANAFNEAAVTNLVDSDYVKIRSTKKLTISNAAGSLGTLAFEPDTGVITNTGTTSTQIRSSIQADSSEGIDYDSASGMFKVARNTLVSNKFNSIVILNIKDSGGSVLKTIYSPGS